MKTYSSDAQISRCLLLSVKIFMLMMMGMALSGCGPLYGLFIAPLTPPKTVEAEYNLKGKKLLVWVDLAVAEDTESAILRRNITKDMEFILKEHKAVEEVVDDEKVMRFRRQHDDAATWPIQKLGQELGSDYVLYVLVNQLNTQHEIGKDFFQGRLAGASKLIETETGRRVWPLAQEQRPFTISKDFTEGTGPTYERRLIEQMSRDLAGQLGPFFYKHKVESE